MQEQQQQPTHHILRVSTNPFLTDEYIGYLEAFGWVFVSKQLGSNTDRFSHPTSKLEIFIKGACIDVMLWNNESVDATTWPKGHSLYASFTGLDKIDYHGFIMLMHVLGTCPLGDFIDASERANAKAIADISMPINSTHN